MGTLIRRVKPGDEGDLAYIQTESWKAAFADEIKNGTKPKKKVWIENETKDFKQKILDSGYTKKIKQNILKLYEEIGTEIFGNSRVVEILGCSEVTATSYLKRMEDELKIIVPVEGMGKGKYKFSV